MRNNILKSVARSLFVSAYADAYETGTIPPELPHAGAQENWSNLAPESRCADLAAVLLVEKTEKLNKKPMSVLYLEATREIEGESHLKEPTPESFGYCIAMQAIGSGVAWTDNHPDTGIKIPNIEVWLDYENPNFILNTSGL